MNGILHAVSLSGKISIILQVKQGRIHYMCMWIQTASVIKGKFYRN